MNHALSLDPAYLTYLTRKFPDRALNVLTVQVNEVLRFLYLVSAGPGAGVPLLVTRELDDIWHALILETAAYSRLCDSLPSGRFLHHTSRDYPDGPEPLDDLARCQIELLVYANYVAVFGGWTAETAAYWPGILRLKHALDAATWADLNAYLSDIAHHSAEDAVASFSG